MALIRLPSWAVSAWFRLPFASAPVLHRAGLAALHEGRPEACLQLLRRAARKYRRDLEVEALARLRVHELIAQHGPNGDPESALEIERRLARLERIESIEPPFGTVPAHALMAAWSGAGADCGATVTAAA